MATSYRPNDLQFYLNEHRYLNKTSWNNINNAFFFLIFRRNLNLRISSHRSKRNTSPKRFPSYTNATDTNPSATNVKHTSKPDA